MKQFPPRILMLWFCVIFAAAHDVCEYRRVSLGIAKTAEDCSSKCINCNYLCFYRFREENSLRVLVEADEVESTRDCIAWGHNLKNEKCSGWVLDTDPDYYEEFYGVGGYSDYSYTNFETCTLAPQTNINVAKTKDADEKSGCFFELENLGFSETAEECRLLCEGLVSKRYGGCLAWSHSEEEKECEGLLSMPTNKFTSCGRL